jgi:hypothetical protein
LLAKQVGIAKGQGALRGSGHECSDGNGKDQRRRINRRSHQSSIKA